MEKLTYKLIVVGASAGGLDALSVLLKGLPGDFPIPIAIVQHLGTEGESRLADILDRECRLRVTEVEDKDPIESGRVYLAPPNYQLSVETDFYFSLSVEETTGFSCPSIDILFASAAEAVKSQLIGVIMTGASRDGAAGLAAVKEFGGYAIVQCPKSTPFHLMPNAAIESANPHFVGTPIEIREQLLYIRGRANNVGDHGNARRGTIVS